MKLSSVVTKAGTAGWLAVAGLLLTACADRPPEAARPREAWAELKNGAGASIGWATLREENGRIQIAVQVTGLTPGRHGIHIHAVGRCEPPGFTTAGEHWNPAGRQHGLANPQGAHAGDLPELEADGSGRARYEATTERLTLAAGPTSLFDTDGSAVVIHAQPDDQRTDPSGNSGDRVACGRIVAGRAPAVRP